MIYDHDCETADENTRALKGCDRPAPEHLRMIARGIEFERCPQAMIRETPEVGYYLRLHRFYQAGFMPFAGSLADQPAILMEAFEIIDQIQSEKADGDTKSAGNRHRPER